MLWGFVVIAVRFGFVILKFVELESNVIRTRLPWRLAIKSIRELNWMVATVGAVKGGRAEPGWPV